MSDIPLKEIKTLDINQEQMFKILRNQLTILDSDAQDQRKQIFESLFNQIALLSQQKKLAEEKAKKFEEMNRILTEKLEKLGVIEKENTNPH